jgi:hypothetical protein
MQEVEPELNKQPRQMLCQLQSLQWFSLASGKSTTHVRKLAKALLFQRKKRKKKRETRSVEKAVV